MQAGTEVNRVCRDRVCELMVDSLPLADQQKQPQEFPLARTAFATVDSGSCSDLRQSFRDRPTMHTFNGIVRDQLGNDRHVRFAMPSAKAVRRAAASRGYRVVSLSQPDTTFVATPKPEMKPVTKQFAVATWITIAIISIGGLLGLAAGILNFMSGAPEMATGERWLMLFVCPLVMAGFAAVAVVPGYIVAIGIIGGVELVRGWMRNFVAWNDECESQQGGETTRQFDDLTGAKTWKRN